MLFVVTVYNKQLNYTITLFATFCLQQFAKVPHSVVLKLFQCNVIMDGRRHGSFVWSTEPAKL